VTQLIHQRYALRHRRFFCAEDHPLGVVLYDSNRGVRWTTKVCMKRRFIHCWSKNLDASLYDLNVGVWWTASQGIRSSGAEEAELRTLLLPNPRSPDESMLGSSVHPTVSFENSSHRTLLTNVEMRVSVHLTLWLELQLIQFNLIWVFHRFFCFYFASMITLSWLTFKEIERAYFHSFWCLVKLLVHAWTPLNSTVKHYKLAIQVSFISLWHLELTKSLAL
jgi:hypothetical protein